MWFLLLISVFLVFIYNLLYYFNGNNVDWMLCKFEINLNFIVSYYIQCSSKDHMSLLCFIKKRAVKEIQKLYNFLWLIGIMPVIFVSASHVPPK